MTRLYDLAAEYAAAFDELSRIEDLSPEVIRDTLAALAGTVTDKLEASVKVIRSFDNRIDGIKAEMERFKKLLKSEQNSREQLASYIAECMELAELRSLKTPLFNITLAKGSAVAVIDNISDIPDEYISVITDIKPDKRKILAALKDGLVIEGAHLENSPNSLRIR